MRLVGKHTIDGCGKGIMIKRYNDSVGVKPSWYRIFSSYHYSSQYRHSPSCEFLLNFELLGTRMCFLKVSCELFPSRSDFFKLEKWPGNWPRNIFHSNISLNIFQELGILHGHAKNTVPAIMQIIVAESVKHHRPRNGEFSICYIIKVTTWWFQPVWNY